MTPMLTPYGMPAGVEPQVWRQSVEARIQYLLDAADRLIDALDRMEPDPDLEPDNDDEPGTWLEDWRFPGARNFDEVADENLENGADDEPELGWSNHGGQGPIIGVTVRYSDIYGGE